MATTPERVRPVRPVLLALAAAVVVGGLLWASSLLPSGTTQGTGQETGQDGSRGPGVGDPAGICAVSVVFEGRTYYGGPAEDVRPGRALGTGTVPPCNDTPGSVDDAEPGTAEVRAVLGQRPEQVVLVGDTLFQVAPDAR